MAGGLPAIEGAIEAIERRADGVDGTLQVEDPGMDLSLHSLLLVCEVCMRHSVVSYECYQRTLRASTGWSCAGIGGAGEGTGAEEGGPVPWCGIVGVHAPFATGGEYYLFIACTAGLYTTPSFSLSGASGGRSGPQGAAVQALAAKEGPRKREAQCTGMEEEVRRLFRKRSRPMPGHAAMAMDIDVPGGAPCGLGGPQEAPEEGVDLQALGQALEGGSSGGDPSSRVWALTIWLHLSQSCPARAMEFLVSTGRVCFVAFEEGACPLTHGLYYRAFLACNTPRRMHKLAQWFGEGHSYQPLGGFLGRHRAYTEAEPRLTKMGREPGAGRPAEAGGAGGCRSGGVAGGAEARGRR